MVTSDTISGPAARTVGRHGSLVTSAVLLERRARLENVVLRRRNRPSHLRGTDSAHGVTLIDDADITHTFDFTTGVNGDLGLQSQVRLAGAGIIAVDAGRVLSLDDGTVLFAAGRHDFLSGDLQTYCAAFTD